jgi:hypothetical protein
VLTKKVSKYVGDDRALMKREKKPPPSHEKFSERGDKKLNILSG